MSDLKMEMTGERSMPGNFKHLAALGETLQLTAAALCAPKLPSSSASTFEEIKMAAGYELEDAAKRLKKIADVLGSPS